MKFGKSKTIVPIEVKNGARYNLELIANITIPEIMIEKFGEILDFGKVICGQRKTVFVRFVNDKEIACEWSQNMRSDMM
jgi:hydrocephalus-inducing protein